MSLADDQRALAVALTAPDPIAALHSSPALAEVDADGFELASLLVVKLRFERLVQGSAPAADWFDADPASFVAAFRAYCCEVPSRSPFPAAEARAFTAWMRERV